MGNVNFIECNTVEEANQVDLTTYRFSERLSAKKGIYCFVLRASKQ